MKVTVVDIEIQGVACLLQNNIEAAPGVGIKPENTKRHTSGIHNDPEEWKDRVYKQPNGRLGHPGAAIESALVKSAREFKADKRRSYAEIVKASCFVNEKFIDLGVKKPDEVNRASVVNPNTRGRGFSYRPQLNPGWKGTFSLTIQNSEVIPIERVKEILDHAGMMVGIGDWRPKFGRFICTKFQVRK